MTAFFTAICRDAAAYRGVRPVLAALPTTTAVLLVVAGDVRPDKGGEARTAAARHASRLRAVGSVRLDFGPGGRSAGGGLATLVDAWAVRGAGALDDVGGAFAAVVWDARTGAVHLLRDHIGLQPLYYAHADGAFLAADSADALAQHTGVDSAVDDDFALSCLLGHTAATVDRSLYRGVRALPPASLGRLATGGELVVEPYWQLPLQPEQSSTDDWVEGLFDVVRAAVTSAVAGPGPFGTHLSGGLDSTAVACLAQRELRRRGERLLAAWSWSPPPETLPLLPDDERPRTQEVARRLDLDLHWTDLTAQDLADWRAAPLSRPLLDGFVHEQAVIRSAAAAGVRVLLSGWGGDEFASYNGRGALAGLVARGRVLESLRGAHRRVPGPGLRGGARAARLLVRDVAAALPARWQRPSEVLQAADRVTVGGRRVDDLHPRARQTLVAKEAPVTRRGSSATQAALLALGHLGSRATTWYEQAADHGIEHRYPLLDRRVVEFATSVPDQVQVAGPSRWIFRQAVQDVVGPELAWGPVKQEVAKSAHQLQLQLAADLRPVEPARSLEPVLQLWWQLQREFFRERSSSAGG